MKDAQFSHGSKKSLSHLTTELSDPSSPQDYRNKNNNLSAKVQ